GGRRVGGLARQYTAKRIGGQDAAPFSSGLTGATLPAKDGACISHPGVFMAHKVRIAIIGAGAVADYHHVPGIRLDPRAELVAACDPNEQLLAKRKSDWSISKITKNYAEIAADSAID